MNKSNLTLYAILAFWVMVLLGVFAFHIAVPIRFLYFIGFLCVGWLAWWSINTVKQVIKGDSEESPTTEKENNQSNKNKSENASE